MSAAANGAQNSLDEATLLEMKMTFHGDNSFDGNISGVATPSNQEGKVSVLSMASSSNETAHSGNNNIVINQIQPRELYEDSTTERLAKFVEKMKAESGKTGEQGFKKEQLQKIKTIVADLSKESEKVKRG